MGQAIAELDEPADRSFSAQARILLMVIACNYIGGQGSRFLLSIYAFKMTGLLSTTVWFNVASTFGQITGGWTSALLMRRFGRRAGIYAASIALPLVFTFLILWPGGSTLWLSAGGYLLGMALGMSVNGHNTYLYEIAREGNRDKLNAADSGIMYVTSTVLVPVIGAIATYVGYTPAFILVLVCFLALPFIVSRLPNTPYEVQIRPDLVLLPSGAARPIFLAFLSFGVYQGFYLLLSSVLAFAITQREAGAGFFNFLFGVGSISTSVIMNRWATTATRPLFLKAACLLLPPVLALLLFPLTIPRIYTVGLLLGLLVAAWLTMMNSTGQQVLSLDPVYGRRSIEYNLGREMAMSVGRLIPFSYLLLSGIQSVDLAGFGWIILVIVFIPPLTLLFMRTGLARQRSSEQAA